MSRKRFGGILCALALSCGTAVARHGFVSFDVPGAASTSASGINAAGAVVGWYVDSAGKTRGFLLNNISAGKFESIDYPGAVYTQPWGINAEGDVVGCHIEDPTRIPGTIGCHGFLLSPGGFTPVDYPGKYGAIPTRINAAGQIVGCNHDDDGPGGIMMDDMHGFMFSHGAFSQLSQKATMNYTLTADGSVTAGVVTIGGATHGFIASNDTVVPFDFPLSTLTVAYDMSPSGDEVVGAYMDRANTIHGFLLRLGYSDGKAASFEFTSIDYPGAARTQVLGMNAAGDLVGFYVDAAGKRHGFLLRRGWDRGGDESR